MYSFIEIDFPILNMHKPKVPVQCTVLIIHFYQAAIIGRNYAVMHNRNGRDAVLPHNRQHNIYEGHKLKGLGNKHIACINNYRDDCCMRIFCL